MAASTASAVLAERQRLAPALWAPCAAHPHISHAISSCRLLRADRCAVAQGFAAQSAVTGEGPYANWAKHVSDPFGYNLLTVLGNEDRLPSL